MLNESALFEENLILSWTMIESHVHNDPILQDMKVVDQFKDGRIALSNARML
jgi:hypothetical protein